jgi:hypothetical protein
MPFAAKEFKLNASRFARALISRWAYAAKDYAVTGFRSTLSTTAGGARLVQTDMVRDFQSALAHTRSALAHLLWLFAPEQLVPALTVARRIIFVSVGVVFVAFTTGYYPSLLLFWGSWYEDHKWIPQPEPGRTIVLMVYFSLGAIYLYILRYRERIVYGCLEVAAAILTFYFTVAAKYPIDTKLESKDYVLAYLQIAAGMYIFVRGLDNIGQGLPPESWMHKLWDKVLNREAAAPIGNDK